MIHRSNDSKLLMICFSFAMLIMGIINSAHAIQQTDTGKIEGKVIEVINVTGYTYVKVETATTKVWAAGPTTALKIDDKVAFSTNMPMQDFYSESMKRTFSLLYFVGRFNTDGHKVSASNIPAGHGKSKKLNKPVKGISKLQGGKSVAEVHTEKNNLNGKTIKVRGQVTRFAADIMGKNWLHIQDSSSFDDLTVTTNKVVAVGDTVIIEGQLELDKDYDYGYIYPVIIQDALVTKE